MRPIPETAIKVSNLSKMFKIYSKPSDMFWELFTGKPSYKPFWALRDISFEVKRGQVVGVLGRNGAGKSILLKIITGTLDKTDGRVDVNGRISSILELGTGFNMEYTGRDNIYLGGLMVGLTREEIKQKEDWIIDFSELRDFIDQPFKTYSSGMQARLTFATAVCIEPDILIVDEAMAVGDIKFQSKCFALMENFRQSGRTILLVSHDLNAIKQFCSHAILLEKGEIIKQGQPKEVADFYHKRLFSPEEKSTPVSEPDQISETLPVETSKPHDTPNPCGKILVLSEQAASKEQIIKKLGSNSTGSFEFGNRNAEFLDVGILDEQGNRTTLLESQKTYFLFSRLLFYEDIDDISLGIVIRNTIGVDLFRMNSFRQQVNVLPQTKGHVLETKIKVKMWLASGDYALTFGITKHHAEPKDKIIDARFDAIHFRVEDDGLFDPPTVVNLQPEWSFGSYNPLDEE